MSRALALLIVSSFLISLYVNCTGGLHAATDSVSALSSGTGSGTTGGGSGSSGTVTPGQNVMAVTVGCGYVNEPCVSVTICEPGTSNCQTINNVLLDTGSYGLRLFSSAISISLSTVLDSSNRQLGECMSYADGSNDWGPVKKADIVMGGETASGVSIQVIDSTFANVPSSCDSDLDTDASTAGFNGIIGLGLFTEDCGSSCVSSASVGVYYGCSGTTCTGTTVPVATQVSNPVSYLPSSNNGVILTMPTVASNGAMGAVGQLILGISTQSNNTLSSVTTMSADSSGNFKTTYNGTSYDAFIDSGSNGLYFPSSITQCSGNDAGFYCPTSTATYSATQAAASGSASKSVSFQVANTDTLVANGNDSFNDLAGAATSYFDWGLPFFFGRSIAVGIENKTSTLGTGPYWAW